MYCSVTTAFCHAVLPALDPGSSLAMQVEALKAEVAELRAAKAASFSLPSTGDVLQSLGLDKWKDDRLRGVKVRCSLFPSVLLTPQRHLGSVRDAYQIPNVPLPKFNSSPHFGHTHSDPTCACINAHPLT